MRPGQLIGYSLNQTSAITSIVGTRIFEGNRISSGTAQTIILPAINYFELAGGTRQNGIESIPYSINCRAVTASTAIQLARLVVDLFHGTSSTGIYGTQNGFDIARCSLNQTQGVIFESADNLYNCPVDIQLVYTSSTVS